MTARQAFIPPQLATLVETAPSGSTWIFEIKYDGYRLQALLRDGNARLLTRRGKDWTDRFPELARRLGALPIVSATFDGEVVVLDTSGRSRFSLLQQSLDAAHEQELTFFAFDLLYLDGEDLRDLPLVERRNRLERVLRKARATSRGPMRLGQQLHGAGPALLKTACRLGLEGIIGKRLDAAYTSGRGPAWVKVKCGHRQEFAVVGFTPPKGARVGIGSLLLAVNDKDGLRYAGRVGSGMPDDVLHRLSARLARLRRSGTPLHVRPAGIPGTVQWTAPRLVVEVAFTEWTGDGLLRHPVFQGIREDKLVSEVRREEPKLTRTTSRKPPTGATEATVAGVRISHPNRVIFPKSGITKLELAEHFKRVAAVMLPHVAARPLSLVRCPEGSSSQCFFQKHWTGTRPPSIDTVDILQSDGKKHPHVVIHDVEGLVTLVQWGVVEVHPWGSRADDPERPDRIIFDLDPGPGVSWNDVKEATRGLHGLLEGLGLDSWLKTSGGKGLHVVVPIARRQSWDEASGFAQAVAEHMQTEFPERFISKSRKTARKGLIFVDWLRNTRGATAVAPWSTRARATAGVSAPIPWSALGRVTAGDEFTLLTIRAHPPRSDPWRDMLSSRQGLSKAMLRALGHPER